jgi:anti-sigma factor ChrR (cupin superfamily)
VKHAAATAELAERAAMYALGAMTQNEARTFEDHLVDGCDVCRIEADQFQVTVEALATATPDLEPPATVPGRVLAAVQMEAAHKQAASATISPFAFVRAGEDGWQETMGGVLIKPLHVDEESGIMTSLVKMAAGMNLPPHEHGGVEQLFILEGDCRVQGQTLGPGDYHRAMPGSVHESTYTEHGTTFLLVAPREYRFIEA